MIPATSVDWLLARAHASPNAAAVFTANDVLDYGQLNELVNRAARSLSEVSQPGDRVACLLPNNLTFVTLVHALARIGAVMVPLNTRLTSKEISWQLRKTNCSLLIYDVATAEQATAASGEDVPLIDGAVLLEQDIDVCRTFPTFELERIQGIIFTSGTTGEPKGAMLSFGNHFYSAIASAFRIGVDSDDRWLCCLPLYHIGGLAIIFRSCLYGTAVILQDGFDAVEVNKALNEQNVTLISLVPTMLIRLLRQRENSSWPENLRLVLLGGAAPSQELIAQCRSLEIPVSTTYGLTEASSQVATMPPEGVIRKAGSVGRSLLFSQIVVRAENGAELPAGEVGEITVKGPTVMLGYDQDVQATREILVNGWLYTGDVGYLDKEGDLWVLQRQNDIIISGGENIYPAEVEAALRSHPGVEEVCVIGLGDAEWGQLVSAAIVVKKGESPTKAEIEVYCREHLAGYKLPRRIAFLRELPKTASGKIRRQEVALIMSSGDLAEKDNIYAADDDS